MAMRIKLALAALLVLAACAAPARKSANPAPAGAAADPLDGPIAYSCSNGAQLMVEADGTQARVAIIGGPSMVLPRAGDSANHATAAMASAAAAPRAQWEVGRAAPVSCSGS